MKTAFALPPASPSTTVASLTDTVGGASSSVIVPTACWSAMVEFVGLARLTWKVSLTSSRRSPFTSTVTVRLTWPGAKVSVVDGTSV